MMLGVVRIQHHHAASTRQMGFHDAHGAGVCRTSLDKANSMVVQGSCGRRQLDVNSDDNGIRLRAAKVQERGEEQDRSPSRHPGLNDEPGSQSSHELLVDLQIEWTLLNGITQECVAVPGPRMIIEPVKGGNDLGCRKIHLDAHIVCHCDALWLAGDPHARFPQERDRVAAGPAGTDP